MNSFKWSHTFSIQSLATIRQSVDDQASWKPPIRVQQSCCESLRSCTPSAPHSVFVVVYFFPTKPMFCFFPQWPLFNFSLNPHEEQTRGKSKEKPKPLTPTVLSSLSVAASSRDTFTVKSWCRNLHPFWLSQCCHNLDFVEFAYMN